MTITTSTSSVSISDIRWGAIRTAYYDVGSTWGVGAAIATVGPIITMFEMDIPADNPRR
jgi:hypothetical protein